MTGLSVEAVDAWLPQTQCTQCGYPNCRAYARAVAEREAGINQCPPGGDATIAGLARLTGTAAPPLDPRFGRHRPRVRAAIDEELCIGCTLCIQACPVDAIIGAAKLMHTVIADLCTGCELCLPPCPVDCIDTVRVTRPAQPGWRWPNYSPEETRCARDRARRRLARLDRQDRDQALAAKHAALRRGDGRRRIKGDIEAALARTRSRRERQRSPRP